MKYFIMAWDDDSESKRFEDFYFIAGKDGKLLLFDSVKEAESFGRMACKYFNIGSWHSYMIGDIYLKTKKLVLTLKYD